MKEGAAVNSLFHFEIADSAGNSGPIDLCNPEPLGVKGSFASIWRAGPAREYAIKSFHEASEDTVRMEYEFLVRLNAAGCPCVPKAICFGTFVDGEGERHFAFVEQFVEGRSLSQVLEHGVLAGDARVHTISPSKAVAVTLEVAKALSHIAKNRLAHRDLSPRNIMLTNACLADDLRNGASVYLVDFGQSTLTDRQTVTQLAPRLATIPYGAPEVFGGDFYEERNSEKCDTWSLGALICTMVAGEYWPQEIADLMVQPMSFGDLQRVAEAKRLPINLASLLGTTSLVLDDLILRLSDLVYACTNYDPAYRPSLDTVVKRLEYLNSLNDVSFPAVITPIVEVKTMVENGDGFARVQTDPLITGYASTPTTSRNAATREDEQLSGGAETMASRTEDSDSTAEAVGASSDSGKPANRTLNSRIGDAKTVAPNPSQSGFHSPSEVTIAEAPATELATEVAPPRNSSLSSDVAPDTVALPLQDHQGTPVNPSNAHIETKLADRRSEFFCEGTKLLRFRSRASEATIPYGVTEIDVCCFMYDELLKRVTIPETVSVIGPAAFQQCTSLHTVLLPSSVARIESGAFEGCRALQRIGTLEGVKFIGHHGFSGCKSIKRVELPSIERIEAEAFAGCRNLQEVKIPDGVVSIDKTAFSDCRRLNESTRRRLQREGIVVPR